MDQSTFKNESTELTCQLYQIIGQLFNRVDNKVRQIKHYPMESVGCLVNSLLALFPMWGGGSGDELLEICPSCNGIVAEVWKKYLKSILHCAFLLS